MDQETRQLIDDVVGATPVKNPLYDTTLSTRERLLLVMLKDFEQHGVGQMHWRQIMEHIGCNKITTYKIINRLLERRLIIRKKAAYYGINY